MQQNGNKTKNLNANVLIVDNDITLIRPLLKIFAEKGIHADVVHNTKAALELFEKNQYDLVITADNLSPASNRPVRQFEGFALLSELTKIAPELPIAMASKVDITKNENIKLLLDTAIRAINCGCCDFLTINPPKEKIEKLLDTAVPNHKVNYCQDDQDSASNKITIVGQSSTLRQTVLFAGKFAKNSAPVLISGESGTGKELVSHLLHYKSRRKQGPFVRVNCAALSETLLESELFGHEKGAFTGAVAKRKGRFELADGGTILLDEVTETPLQFQAKLLRVLEQQSFERVGGNENVSVNVRVISTSNKDIADLVRKGKFRLDLYYRLSALRIVVPPLRNRTEDIEDLIWYFINIYAPQTNRVIKKLDPDMMDMFRKYHWPGNIRQLRNVIMTSLILGSSETLTIADTSWLFDNLQPTTPPEMQTFQTPAGNMLNNTNIISAPNLGTASLSQVEKHTIIQTLKTTQGNQTKAAKILGISDRTLRDKVKKYKQQDQNQLQTV